MPENPPGQTTVEKGALFRDRLVQHLEAGGHPCTIEVRLNHKKVDILCKWQDNLHGERRLLVEAKDHKSLTMPKCVEFLTHYGSLVNGKQKFADAAWLVSNGNISPDARALIEAEEGLRCFTYHEFLRRISGLEIYLREFLDEIQRSSSIRIYAPAKTAHDADLEAIFLEWLADSNARPLLILGAYGVGKSTFSSHIARSLGAIALHDPSARIPILVPLGEIFDEQSSSGLFGRLLADRFNAPGYNYRLFTQLNREGALLIIFDGLDEMADAMTTVRFERNFRRLLELDQEKSKIVFLGRDTVFHTSEEYNRIVAAETATPSGTRVLARTRRPLQSIEMRGFTRQEAAAFIEEYFPIVAQSTPSSSKRSARWVSRRVEELTSPSLGDLIERPVHIEMLCDIATQPEISLTGLSRHRLYDTFVQHLIEREISKPVRYHGFGVEVRRAFNSHIAWWAWLRDDGRGVRFADIPSELCEAATQGTFHEYDADELKRELIAGCLVDGGGDYAYFKHRSIQEFLIAEYILNFFQFGVSTSEFEAIFYSLARINNPDIIDFMIGRLEQQEWPDNIVFEILNKFYRSYRGTITRVVLDFVRRIVLGRQSVNPSKESDRSVWRQSPHDGPWEFIISYMISLGCTEFKFAPDQFESDWRALRATGVESDEVRCAALMTWARSIYESSSRSTERYFALLSETLVRPVLSGEMARDSAYRALLPTMAVEVYGKIPHIEVNLEMLWNRLGQHLDISIEEPPPTDASRLSVRRASIDDFAESLVRFEWPKADVERLCAFLINREYRADSVSRRL